jgi:amidohydrolase
LKVEGFIFQLSTFNFQLRYFMIDFYKEAQKLFPYSQSIRRDLHMHPELGYQEVRTSGIIAKELRELGLETTTGIAKTGVIGMIEGSKSGPVIMLRFDIDALPIKEETNAEYASCNPGVMHACGHDGHVAIGLTVARLLNQHRDEINGTIKLVFQPAEEGMGGADRMVKEGVMENPSPLRSLGLHIWNDNPIGWLGIAAGPVMAGAATFKVIVTGKGGHAAAPHLTIDPVLAVAQIVSAAQGIVARNVNPQQAAVISFTTIHGGDAFNVIPQQVEMTGTIRYFEQQVRDMLFPRFEQVVHSVAEGMGCQASVEIHDLTPAVVNDPQVTKSVKRAAESTLPGHTIDERGHITMGSEDFAYFQQKAPGTYFFVGSNNAEKGLNYGHHHPKFDFDEGVLPRAAALMAASAVELLQEKSH